MSTIMQFSQIELDEELKEAACYGECHRMKDLIREGADVNSRNVVNGWTPLHWAAYRNHEKAVHVLLQCGADKNIKTNTKCLAGELSTNKKIQELLGCKNNCKEQFQLPFTPNYLKNLPMFASSSRCPRNEVNLLPCNSNKDEDLVLKARIADSKCVDFIEIELPKSELTMEKLEAVCTEELELENPILFIRKLPNTRLRNDKDINRLKEYQELEVVLDQKK